MFCTLARHAIALAEKGYGVRWHELQKVCLNCGQPRVNHHTAASGVKHIACPMRVQLTQFKPSVSLARGYIASFLESFVQGIAQRLIEERERVVAEATTAPASDTTGFVGATKIARPIPEDAVGCCFTASQLTVSATPSRCANFVTA
jgi:hypothetical protein